MDFFKFFISISILSFFAWLFISKSNRNKKTFTHQDHNSGPESDSEDVISFDIRDDDLLKESLKERKTVATLDLEITISDYSDDSEQAEFPWKSQVSEEIQNLFKKDYGEMDEVSTKIEEILYSNGLAVNEINNLVFGLKEHLDKKIHRIKNSKKYKDAGPAQKEGMVEIAIEEILNENEQDSLDSVYIEPSNIDSYIMGISTIKNKSLNLTLEQVKFLSDRYKGILFLSEGLVEYNVDQDKTINNLLDSGFLTKDLNISIESMLHVYKAPQVKEFAKANGLEFKKSITKKDLISQIGRDLDRQIVWEFSKSNFEDHFQIVDRSILSKVDELDGVSEILNLYISYIQSRLNDKREAVEFNSEGKMPSFVQSKTYKKYSIEKNAA